MTDAARLAAIGERLERATALPWKVCADEAYADYAPLVCSGPGEEHQAVATPHLRIETFTPEDAEFIAHAREDIPWLLARVAAQQQEIAALREAAGAASNAVAAPADVPTPWTTRPDVFAALCGVEYVWIIAANGQRVGRHSAATADFIVRAVNLGTSGSRSEATHLREALERLTRFVDGPMRTWMPSDHTNCLIDSGCAHGADERDIFEELDRQLDAARAALRAVAEGDETKGGSA